MRHIHSSIVSRHLATIGNNKILHTPPPPLARAMGVGRQQQQHVSPFKYYLSLPHAHSILSYSHTFYIQFWWGYIYNNNPRHIQIYIHHFINNHYDQVIIKCVYIVLCKVLYIIIILPRIIFFYLYKII